MIQIIPIFQVNKLKSFSLIKFSLDNFELKFNDYITKNIKIDTNLNSLKKSNSNYFNVNKSFTSNIFLMDMYSFYQIKYNQINQIDDNEINNEIQSNLNFEKLITMENFPNKFLSDFYYDRFFILNENSIKIFDNNFLLTNSKNFISSLDNTINTNSKFLNISLENLKKINPNQGNLSKLFMNIKNFNFINNEISWKKSQENYSNKNFNNFSGNNKIKKDAKLEYFKGCFFGDPNLAILINQHFVNLMDFRVFIFLLLGFQI